MGEHSIPWQHHTTPRQYYEIIEGYPYSGEEDMEISDEDDLPPLENLAPLSYNAKLRLSYPEPNSGSLLLPLQQIQKVGIPINKTKIKKTKIQPKTTSI